MFEMTSGADWLIAGLGNPEPKYDGTRHNAGFEALDYLAAQWQCDIAKAKWQGLYGTAQVNGHKVERPEHCPRRQLLQDPGRPHHCAVR